MYAFVCRPSVCPRVATGVLVDRAGRAEAAYPNIPDGSNYDRDVRQRNSSLLPLHPIS